MVAFRETLRPGPRLPVADAPALAAPGRRTTVLRFALAAALAGLLALCLALAARGDTRPSSYFASGSTGVIVIDFSTSIDPSKYRRIARVIRTVADTSQPVGLVVYSDSAYEAVPPGTPGDVLRPLLRYFEQPAGMRGMPPGRFGPGARQGGFGFGGSPWQRTFRGGTRISSGLRVAREILTRDGGGGSVLLVSDLDDSPFDINRLTEEAILYRRQHIDLRLVPLAPGPEDREMFSRLVGPEAFVGNRELLRNSSLQERRTLVGSFPALFVLGSALLLFLLAFNERTNGRLRWRPERAT